jgi:GT2 family glycosyltransferase
VSALDLSIVLINWNSFELTSRALTAIRSGTHGVTYETIVIDNGSTLDDSVTGLPARFPWIRLVENDRNHGFSRAANQGLRLGSGRNLLLLNSDTVILGNAIGEAVHYLEAHPAVGALGLLHYHADGRTIQETAFPFPRPLAEIASTLGLRRLASGGQQPCRESDVDWICGSFWLIRRAALEQVGGLDERFFAYDEDIDWCRRARAAGWAIRFWPGAALIHAGSAAKPFMRDKTFVHFRSRLSYLYKHHGRAAAWLYYAAMLLLLAGAAAKQAALLAGARGRAGEARARCERFVRFALLRPGGTGG